MAYGEKQTKKTKNKTKQNKTKQKNNKQNKQTKTKTKTHSCPPLNCNFRITNTILNDTATERVISFSNICKLYY